MSRVWDIARYRQGRQGGPQTGERSPTIPRSLTLALIRAGRSDLALSAPPREDGEGRGYTRGPRDFQAGESAGEEWSCTWASLPCAFSSSPCE